MDISNFTSMLNAHTWSFTIEDPCKWRQAVEAERSMYSLALIQACYFEPPNDNFLKNYHRSSLLAMEHSPSAQGANKKLDRMTESVTIKLKNLEDSMLTGDDEFDTFIKALRNMDWYYEYSDDLAVWRYGKSRYVAMEKAAKEKGGLYLSAWNRAIAKAWPLKNSA